MISWHYSSNICMHVAVGIIALTKVIILLILHLNYPYHIILILKKYLIRTHTFV